MRTLWHASRVTTQYIASSSALYTRLGVTYCETFYTLLLSLKSPPACDWILCLDCIHYLMSQFVRVLVWIFSSGSDRFLPVRRVPAASCLAACQVIRICLLDTFCLTAAAPWPWTLKLETNLRFAVLIFVSATQLHIYLLWDNVEHSVLNVKGRFQLQWPNRGPNKGPSPWL